jgi:hypothetical protein
MLNNVASSSHSVPLSDGERVSVVFSCAMLVVDTVEVTAAKAVLDPIGHLGSLW